MNDLKNAVRQFVRRPSLSLVVVLMLALGIGATTAVYSLFHEILVRSLPVPEPERLVNLGAPGPKPGSQSCNTAGDCNQVFSYPMFRDLEAQQAVFSGIAAHRNFDANLASDGNTLSGSGMLVSGGYFSTLNVQPALGRLIGPQDEPGIDASAVVVLTHDYWLNQFGGDEGVIGQSLTVNGQPLTIVGVAPEGFAGTTIGLRPQVYVPLTLGWLMRPTMPRDSAENRRAYWVYVFGRLASGVSLEQASAGVNGLYAGILNDVEVALQVGMSPEDLERFRERRITVEPGARGQSIVPGVSAPALSMLLGVTVLVLLIVCVNIANLLLARGASRAGEMAIRASIGAGRRHLVSQLLAEAGVLAVIGGLLSLLVAYATLGGIVAIAPAEAQAEPWGLGGAAMLFATAATLGTVLLFGLVPALRAAGTDPGAVVKGQASQSSGTRGVVRFRAVLATAQIGFSTVLLVLAGLFTQSLVNIARIDLGMDVDSLVTFTVSPRLNGYTPEQATSLYDRMEEGLGAWPGVTAVASSSVALLARDESNAVLDVAGFEAGYPQTHAATSDVSPGFFAALSIPLLAGRDFTAADRLETPRVAVVNESFLRKFDLGERALGTRFGLDDPGSPGRNIEIVGVVGDAKYSEVKGEIPPQFFLPRRQNDNLGTMTFYLRGAVQPDALIQGIRQAVGEIDANLPLAGLTTMERQVRDNVFLDRLVTMLAASLALLATLLAAIGLYGVLAYNIAQRTRELGLRLALGAPPTRLRTMVLKQVGVMAVVGGAIGLAAAVGLGRAVEALLFGLAGHDPRVLMASVAVLSVIVLGASYLPARRASSVAPMEALRYE